MKKYFVLFFIVLFATITIWADFSFAQRRSTRRAATTGRSTKKTSASENSNETTEKNSGRSTKRAATGGRSTKRAATSSTGRSTKRAATGGRSTKRAATSSTGRSTKRAATGGRSTKRAATSSTGRKTQRAATSSTGRSVRRSSTNRARPFGRGKNSGSTRVVSKTPVVVEEVKVELVDCPVYSMIKKVQPKDENGTLAVDESGNDLFKYYKYASTGDIECKLNDEYMNEDENPWSYNNTKEATSANISSNPKYFKAYIADVKNDDESLEFIYIACKDGFIKRGDIKKGFNCLDISSICPLIARGVEQGLGQVEKDGKVYLNTNSYDECTLPAHSIHYPETNSLYCKEGYYASGNDTVKYECLACPSESKTDWLDKNLGGNYPTECPETGSASQQETTENGDDEGDDASSENDGTTNNENTAFDGIITIEGEKVCDGNGYKGQGTYTKDLTKTEELVCVKSNITITENDCWVSDADDGKLKAEFTNKDKDGKEVDYYYCKCPQYEGRQMLGDGLKTIDASSSNHYCQLVKTWLVATQKMQETDSYPAGYEICNNTINALPFNQGGYEGTKIPRGCIPDCGEGEAWLPIDDNAK